jgi:ribA/ribD-fused uncharacterized protein
MSNPMQKKKNGHGGLVTTKRVLEIKFYRSNEKPHGIFSNLYPSPVQFEGKQYPTAEHAYQAGKARKQEVRDWILGAPSPALAAMAAHGLYTWHVTPNWAEIKFDRMRQVLRAKFEQNPDLRNILLGTGQARLVEAGTVNNAVNRLWGEVNGVGQNMLGVMLMELRAEFSVPSKANAQQKKKTKGAASSFNEGSMRRQTDSHPTAMR